MGFQLGVMARVTMYTCIKCGKNKAHQGYSKEQLATGELICNLCKGESKGSRYYHSKAEDLEVHIKIRKCLKCGDQFKSFNWYRLCDYCRLENSLVATSGGVAGWN